MENKLKGGKSDKLTIEDIARKHSVFIGTAKQELEKGKKVESEHTDDKCQAEEIAMDHLFEDIYYYKKLEHMEKKQKKLKKEPKEQTMADASGSYDAPAFGSVVTKSKLQEMIRNSKQVNEIADAGISAGSMYDGPIGTAGPSSPMDKTKKKRKDPLALDEKSKSASITAASTKDMIATKKGFPRFGGPDAKFVEIDSKCKTFPYCNQGNQGQIKFVNEMKTAIKKAAKKYGLSEAEITRMVQKEAYAMPKDWFTGSNEKAIKGWASGRDKVTYHLTTNEPLDITTSDEGDLGKFEYLLARYDVKFEKRKAGEDVINKKAVEKPVEPSEPENDDDDFDDNDFIDFERIKKLV